MWRGFWVFLMVGMVILLIVCNVLFSFEWIFLWKFFSGFVKLLSSICGDNLYGICLLLNLIVLFIGLKWILNVFIFFVNLGFISI